MHIRGSNKHVASCLTVWPVLLLLLQLPPMPGRNYMYSGDYIDEISRDKVVPEGERQGQAHGTE